MNKIIATLIVAAALAPVAALAAAPSGDATKSAQATCTALRASMGATAFGQAYSTFGACVSKYAPVEQASITSAQATCTAEQADANFAASHNGKTFDQFYGTGNNGKNAFGNCVSSHAKASAQDERQNRVNPAKTCKALRTSLGDTVFAQTYGKNENDRNAFGKCVSAKARAQVSNELSASATCKAEQDADATAFASKYDSFGDCVSTLARSESAAQQQATVKAAKACAAELKAGAAAFATKYGTFGKCVSTKTKA
jgi:hypothetical protein